MVAGLLAVVVAAGITPQEVLARVDRAYQTAKDAVLTLEVQVFEDSNLRGTRRLRIWQRGAEQRLVKFLDPPRLRGVGILVAGNGVTYLYLPAIGRVRPVAGRSSDDAFMGTDFSIDDLARVRFGDRYRAEALKEEQGTWVLDLVPVVPEDVRHARLRMWVRTEDAKVRRIDYLDAEGAPMRRIVLEEFTRQGAYVTPHRIVVDDARRHRRTLARVIDAKFDVGLHPRFFSERTLTRDVVP